MLTLDPALLASPALTPSPMSHLLLLTSALPFPLQWGLKQWGLEQIRRDGLQHLRMEPPTRREETLTADVGATVVDAPTKCPVKKARQYVDRLDKTLTLMQDVERANAANPFLQGNFAPIEKEQPPTPIQVVEGAIPSDFPAGCYLRIGPNPVHGPRELDKRVHCGLMATG